MAIEIPPQIIKEIAEWLEMGMLCFYDKTTGELEFYPDELRDPGFDDELWKDTIKKVKKNRKNYIPFEGMSSLEGFRVMADFVDNINDMRTRSKFLDAISRKKSYSNFNNLLSYYPNLREQWFAHKRERYIEFVNKQLLTQ